MLRSPLAVRAQQTVDRLTPPFPSRHTIRKNTFDAATMRVFYECLKRLVLAVLGPCLGQRLQLDIRGITAQLPESFPNDLHLRE